MKPSVAQHFTRLLRSIPVARKYIWAPHNNLIVIAELHLNTRDRWSDTTGHDAGGIVHRTDSRGLGQSVNLQHRNSQHAEVILRFRSQRSRPADQSLQIPAYHLFADRRKNHGISQPRPEGIDWLRPLLF